MQYTGIVLAIYANSAWLIISAWAQKLLIFTPCRGVASLIAIMIEPRSCQISIGIPWLNGSTTFPVLIAPIPPHFVMALFIHWPSLFITKFYLLAFGLHTSTQFNIDSNLSAVNKQLKALNTYANVLFIGLKQNTCICCSKTLIYIFATAILRSYRSINIHPFCEGLPTLISLSPILNNTPQNVFIILCIYRRSACGTFWNLVAFQHSLTFGLYSKNQLH